jgi:hypothetical protein
VSCNSETVGNSDTLYTTAIALARHRSDHFSGVISNQKCANNNLSISICGKTHHCENESWGTSETEEFEIHPRWIDNQFILLICFAKNTQVSLFINGHFQLTPFPFLPYTPSLTPLIRCSLYPRNTKGGVSLDCWPPLWFGLVCFENKNKNCQFSCNWFKTSQTGGQWYSDNSPFSFPCFICLPLSLSLSLHLLPTLFLPVVIYHKYSADFMDSINE